RFQKGRSIARMSPAIPCIYNAKSVQRKEKAVVVMSAWINTIRSSLPVNNIYGKTLECKGTGS
ncbi:MAG TPA: hypothetical protein VNY36_05015, partial [Bacteroidia bacterium]|nr:hypothetical protein [Bacteroidia bacterium]